MSPAPGRGRARPNGRHGAAVSVPSLQQAEFTESDWHELPFAVELLRGVLDYVSASPTDQGPLVSKRRYERTSIWRVAICLAGDDRFACYTRDLSRSGIGFYCTSWLDRGRLIDLWLPQCNSVSLRVVRCERLALHCYEVGAKHAGDLST